ncbi:hypothetical protein ACJMK2_029387 [Sinanodonta woodiana]|uniref:Uncharacterized protein n=1 Tax=Sinanodonta woodiana TaxID=1069815 RepID=A0ABD3XA08_SINWO
MTRPQVSIANFYDWSEDANDGVSVPKVYRQISGIPKGFTNSFNRSHVKQWCADGVYLNPGRMFIRDKAALTKGEREIIEGIYKNRGDFQREGKQSAKGDMSFVRGHKDAWLVGKRLSRSELTQEVDDVDFLRLPDYLFSKSTDNVKPPTSKCFLCAKCVDDCRHHKQNAFSSVDLADNGRVAPPTTPDNSPQTLRRKGKVPPIINGQGGAFVDDSCKGDGPQKKRVYVEVFLPKIPTEAPDEGTLLNFTLSREKPIIANSASSVSVDKSSRTPRSNNQGLNKISR